MLTFIIFSVSFYSIISASKEKCKSVVFNGKELSFICKRIFGAVCSYHNRIGSFGCAITGSLFFNQL
jgi:hypothetical protein